LQYQLTTYESATTQQLPTPDTIAQYPTPAFSTLVQPTTSDAALLPAQCSPPIAPHRALVLLQGVPRIAAHQGSSFRWGNARNMQQQS
jgi:hypothetical protein